MTINITLPEANNHFLELIQQIKTGEEVLISEAGIVIARISPMSNAKMPRVPGQDKGRVTMSADFNEPLPSDILDGFLNPSEPQI
ncbi:type II toxin-antitoxin system Phd/YefM family antitoxin [Chamaesiphon sp. VAR_69_metabat_338]|uniref:type II toxin-antitoxin system Phd/YefM family antitoxin n=1 Tax=Chamaesiphon sp. VAR_69_metabat_338 TaxID=2964704 RepID=UPI00286DBFFA|nr:type II toxin-antitoxin system Phd/YefM family antitoxin [Chamaesiphon sp. VAR_69_metabat_338]